MKYIGTWFVEGIPHHGMVILKLRCKYHYAEPPGFGELRFMRRIRMW
jgi:hypothetical protein